MQQSISNYIRYIAADSMPGDIIHKVKLPPKQKPPRRQPAVQNKSQKSDYMKNFMKNYREDGKDYQKMPASIKKMRREQRQRLKEKFCLKGV